MQAMAGVACHGHWLVSQQIRWLASQAKKRLTKRKGEEIIKRKENRKEPKENNGK